MELMTPDIKEKLINTKIADDDKLEELPIIAKYFYPMGRYTFYALDGTQYDDDIIMYGYVLSPVSPDFDEYGPVSLRELESIPLMERDLYLKEDSTLLSLGVIKE